MFESYEIDFGKLNLNWLHSVRIELAEIQELLIQVGQASTYIRQAGQFERLGYTTGYRKFIAVLFTLNDQTLVIDDVNLPDYGAIRIAVIKEFLEESN